MSSSNNPLSPSELSNLRKAFADCINGYSVGLFNGNNIYIKHLSHLDHLDLDLLEQSYIDDALKRGLPSESDRLKYLAKHGYWSDAKEAEIESQRNVVIRFEEGRKNLIVPSMIETHDKAIQQEREKLNKLIGERMALIGHTADSYASSRIHDVYILRNTFSDIDLRNPLYKQCDFDDLSDLEVSNILLSYENAVKPCAEVSLRRLACQDFFQQYYRLCNDDLKSFYGKDICRLTYYQVRLGNYGRYFKNLFENNDLSGLDPVKRADPDAIERHISAKKGAEEAISAGRAPVGMTKNDIKEMGLENRMSKMPNKEMNMIEFSKNMNNPT